MAPSGDSSEKDLLAGSVAPGEDRHVLRIDTRVMLAGGLVALVGVGLLAAFLWMVPSAAAREAVSACRGMRGFERVAPALCPSGQPCSLPVPAPEFTATDHQGKPVKLSDFRGKVVLLNFWASWCGVCKTEKPSLAGVASELGGDDLTVLTVASDRAWSDVLIATIGGLAPSAPVPSSESGEVALPTALDAYRKALPAGVPYRVLLDPPEGDNTIGKITASWGVTKVPESALIDRKGNIRAYFVNRRDWTSAVAQTCLRSIIDED